MNRRTTLPVIAAVLLLAAGCSSSPAPAASTTSTTAAAQARETYIQGILKADPMLGAEYDYVVGDVLVRVSQYLTPAQAQAYQAAA